MRPGPKPPPPERAARVLVDADTFGECAAARRHGVSRFTLRNWRRRFGADSNFQQLRTALRAQVAASWLDEARAARQRTVRRLGVVAESSQCLRAVTVALQRINELITVHEVLRGEGT